MARDTVAAEIDRLAGNIVREKLNDAVDARSAPHASFTGPEGDAVNGILSRVPPDQGFYFKIYKKHPVPDAYGKRPVFLLDIQQPDLIRDLESHLQQLAKIHAWGDGIYEVRKFQVGQQGQLESVQVTLHVPVDLPDPKAANGTSPSHTDPMESIRTTAGLIKELQNASPSLSPDSITKAVTEAVKTIVDATKSQNPAQAPLNILDIVTALKNLMPPPVPAQNPLDLLTLVTKLQAVTNPPRPPETSIIQTLIQLKQAGLLGSDTSHTDPTTKAIELLSNLAPLIQSLSGGGGGGGESSFSVELVRALGPQVGKIVGDVTETINKVVTSRVETAPRRITPPTAPTPTIQGPPNAEVNAPTVKPPEEDAMLPMFRPIKEAIETRDHKFFPRIEELLVMYAGTAYEQLVAGVITIDQVIEYVKPLGGGFLDSEKSRVYMTDFLAWARAKREAVVKEASPVSTPPIVDEASTLPALSAKCPNCKLVFDYDDEAAFAEEPNCEDCNVALERVVEEGENA